MTIRSYRAAAARALLAALALLAAASPSTGEWRRIDSPNLVVVGDVGARRLREIAVEFEGFRETLRRVLPVQVTSAAVPTVVVVFPDGRALNPVKPRYKGKAVDVSGLFMSRPDVNYIAIVASEQAGGLRVVFHEYAHLVISNVLRNPPTWLNEGLAEYYSAYQTDRSRREAILGAPIEWHLAELNERPLLPVEQLLEVDHNSTLYNEGSRRSVFYAQSWALVHMIVMARPHGVAELSTYLRAIAGGEGASSAWKTAFGNSDMDGELWRYVRRRSLPATRFTFSERLTSLAPEALPIPAADARTFVAELLIAQGRHEEADRMLDEATKLDAGSARLKVVTSMLGVARQDYAAARRLVTDAIAPTDWLAAYLAAVTVSDAIRRGAERSEPELIAARRLFNGLPPGRAELPNVLARLSTIDLASREGPSDATRARIERARGLSPGRDDYAFIHASVLAGLGEFAAARSVLGPYLAPGNPPTTRAAARALMGQIVELERAHKPRLVRGQPAEAPRFLAGRISRTASRPSPP